LTTAKSSARPEAGCFASIALNRVLASRGEVAHAWRDVVQVLSLTLQHLTVGGGRCNITSTLIPSHVHIALESLDTANLRDTVEHQNKDQGQPALPHFFSSAAVQKQSGWLAVTRLGNTYSSNLLCISAQKAVKILN
jgi:hypothetical protein